MHSKELVIVTGRTHSDVLYIQSTSVLALNAAVVWLVNTRCQCEYIIKSPSCTLWKYGTINHSPLEPCLQYPHCSDIFVAFLSSLILSHAMVWQSVVSSITLEWYCRYLQTVWDGKEHPGSEKQLFHLKLWKTQACLLINVPFLGHFYSKLVSGGLC